MAEYLHNDVIIAPPGSKERIKGKEAYIHSYIKYDRAAQTDSFETDKPQIDILGTIAVAKTEFRVKYRIGEYMILKLEAK